MTNDTKRPAVRRMLVFALSGLLSLAVAGESALAAGSGGSGGSYLAAIRKEHGLPALARDGKLEKAATEQAGYMARAGKMAHSTGWRKNFATRMNNNSIRGAAAENVAYGAFSTQKLFAMWMASNGHRRNMLNPRYRHYGLASVDDGQGRSYWVLVLSL